jgi:hypothetical protein
MRGHRCAMKDLLIALLDTPGEANPAGIQGGTVGLER